MKKALLALVVIGCASVRASALHLDRASATIDEATALGAADVPPARRHLELAKEQMQLARKMENLADVRAPLMLARAQADADLALALTKEQALRRDVKRATEEAARERGAP